ncbi:uncharacterized protein LOC127711389 [Mytilus californianus]|uniref:uncharacterized protein LOC127711389 n=1 Tax=Mytilus californianus TaxID=6549 RepID=UPI0022467513|nr:uncharacterized protein LOC127711389 [Mytilus californianus]
MWRNYVLLSFRIEEIPQITKIKWILEWFVVLQVLPFCIGTLCPSNVQREAFSCFAGYSTQLLNMQKSSETLFTGVDVELLRAFCSSYIQSMTCVDTLKKKCPSTLHEKIEVTLFHFEGAREELSELCKDDALYEVYARHMTCFLTSGSYSERCFEDTMNTSVRLMSRFDDKSLPQLCRDFRKTLNCIQTKIKRRCNEEAAGLVPILVKPMVRRSNLCDLNHDSHILMTSSTTAQTTTEDNVITDSIQHRIEVRHNLSKDESNMNSARATTVSCTTILVLICIIYWIYGNG